MRKLICDESIEVIGQAVLSYVDNIEAYNIAPLLAENGISDIQPDQWYPLLSVLNTLNQLTTMPNLTTNFVAVGLRIAENMVLPPELVNAHVSEILMLWDDLYHLQHRGGEIGYVKVEKISETHYKTIHKHLYPDDLVYGLAYGMCRVFLPKDATFTVEYDKDTKRLDEGGDFTIVHVKWETSSG